MKKDNLVIMIKYFKIILNVRGEINLSNYLNFEGYVIVTTTTPPRI
jgi:hypothetical protein